MASEHEIKRALGGEKEGERKGEKLHTHGVHYERAHNGGVIAHVHRHTGTPGGADHAHHHIEEHVLPDIESAQQHLEEQMGDQPAAGEMEPQAATEPEPEPQPQAAAGGM